MRGWWHAGCSGEPSRWMLLLLRKLQSVFGLDILASKPPVGGEKGLSRVSQHVGDIVVDGWSLDANVIKNYWTSRYLDTTIFANDMPSPRIYYYYYYFPSLRRHQPAENLRRCEILLFGSVIAGIVWQLPIHPTKIIRSKNKDSRISWESPTWWWKNGNIHETWRLINTVLYSNSQS